MVETTTQVRGIKNQVYNPVERGRYTKPFMSQVVIQTNKACCAEAAAVQPPRRVCGKKKAVRGGGGARNAWNGWGSGSAA